MCVPGMRAGCASASPLLLSARLCGLLQPTDRPVCSGAWECVSVVAAMELRAASALPDAEAEVQPGNGAFPPGGQAATGWQADFLRPRCRSGFGLVFPACRALAVITVQLLTVSDISSGGLPVIPPGTGTRLRVKEV